MPLHELFDQAVTSSKLLPVKPGNETLLNLYALYKQATLGDATADAAPANAFDFVGKAKYDSWAALKGKSKEHSMEEYIQLVNSLK